MEKLPSLTAQRLKFVIEGRFVLASSAVGPSADRRARDGTARGGLARTACRMHPAQAGPRLVLAMPAVSTLGDSRAAASCAGH